MKNLDVNNPTEIEKNVSEKMAQLQTVPMNEEMSGLLISLMFMKKDFEMPEDKKPFLYAVIEKRVEHCFTFKITDARLILLLAIVSVNPGTAVMYLWYLQYWCFKNNVKEIDLDVVCGRIFPMGFFKEKDLEEIWDEQKVKSDGGSDNLVDYASAGTSIQFK